MHRSLRLKASLLLLIAVGLLGLNLNMVGAASNPVSASLVPATNHYMLSNLATNTCTLVVSTRTCDLWAKTGTISLPGLPSVTIWGYSDTAGGAAQLPGPALVVNQGETVVVNLHNTLPQPSSLAFPGMAIVPDMVGAAATNGTKTYTFSASQPGTFLYEAGLTPNGARQVALGLFGGLVVRPSGGGGGYNGGPTNVSFDDEALLVVSEIDPALNANPTGFDIRSYNPKFWLINGKAYPSTAAISTGANHKVLLRYLNAGLHDHSIGTLGLRQTVVGIDGRPLTYSYQVVAETLGAGQSLDTVTTIPSGATAGTKYALYNAAQHLDNSGTRNGDGTIAFGGMLTFLTVAGSSGGSGGPATSNVVVSPATTNATAVVNLTAQVSASGGPTAAAAEYFIDTTGTDGTGAVMSGSFGSATVNVNATISIATLGALSAGNHTVYVHGKDSAGAWGAVSSTSLFIDKIGPASSGTLSPAATNGTSGVAIQGTASDSANGNSNVTQAEYFIGATGANGTGTALTLTSPNTPVTEVTATIAQATVNGLSQGSHTVSIHAKDSFNNWGAFSVLTLKVDKTGPNATNVVASPNPNNGLLNFDNNTPGVKLTATVTDPTAGGVNSSIQRVESFIDTTGANGTGSTFLPVDGAWDSPTENGYLVIPLTTIQTLTTGPHTLRVHGQDAAGNWGPIATTTFVLDKTGPTISGLAASPNPTGGATSVTLTATASDTASGGSNIVAAEWFEGTDPGQGNATAMSASDGSFNSASEGLTATINVTGWTLGNHVLSVRARDAATNWSTLATVTLVIQPGVNIFADSFEAGNTNAWNSVNGAARLSVTAGAAMAGGTRGLQVTVGNNQTAYVQDNTPNAESVYRARFYFNPNGATTGGNQHDIFVGLNGNTIIFRVQYQFSGGNYQIRAGVVANNGNTTFTNWYTITNAAHPIEISWQSATNAPFSLYIDGALKQTVNSTTTNRKVDTVRLGAVSALGGANRTEFFDAFVSTRGTTVIGP